MIHNILHKNNTLKQYEKASEYLEQHQVYQLFQSLMSSLAINRPSDPTEFIIQTLTSQDPCKICTISNNKSLSEKCTKILQSQFKQAKVYNIENNQDHEEFMDSEQLKSLQSETNFILQNYPQNKKQALHLLDSRVIPDRVFIISKLYTFFSHIL